MDIDKRKFPRLPLNRRAIILGLDGSILGTCELSDVSRSGAKIEPRRPRAIPDKFVLVMSQDGRLRRHCSVSWRTNTALDVRFVAPSHVWTVRVAKSFLSDAGLVGAAMCPA